MLRAHSDIHYIMYGRLVLVYGRKGDRKRDYADGGAALSANYTHFLRIQSSSLSAKCTPEVAAKQIKPMESAPAIPIDNIRTNSLTGTTHELQSVRLYS